jgi:RNA polymerase sigma-70 factor (ECF subfamily)
MESLLRSVTAGQSAAFSEFYRRTSKSVFGTANALLRCEQDAQEVMGDVYLHVWNHAERYDPLRGPVTGWLAGLTRHKAIDRYRRRRSSTAHRGEQGSGSAFADQTQDVVEGLLCVEINRELHHALRLLPPRRRRMIGLAFFRGMSHQEIAAELSMPLGSVKSHIRRGLILLKQNLADSRTVVASNS